MESITGIKGLIPDPYFLGAGIHEIKQGGHISVHADFNHHKLMYLERRINVLIYLNKNWKKEYGGGLELWDQNMTTLTHDIVPLFNRCVIFNTTSNSQHGNPQPVAHPAGESRKSIALYYYTATWDGRKRSHTTQFRVRPGSSDKFDWRVKLGELKDDLLPPLIARRLRRFFDFLPSQRFLTVVTPAQSGRASAPPGMIRSHNGLRGIAALLVVAYHLQYRPGHLAIEDKTTFFARSYLMVDLFFILSGFIMAYVHEVDRPLPMTKTEVSAFWLKRVIRIYPLHFLVLVSMIAYNVLLMVYGAVHGTASPAVWTPQSMIMLFVQFLLINAWLPAPNGWNIPSWSISAEFVAYAIFPLLILAMVKLRKIAMVTLLAAAGAFYVIGTARASLDITGGIGAPLRCLAGFALGFLLYAGRGAFTRMSNPVLGIAQVVAVCWIAAIMMFPSCDGLVIPGFVLLVGLTWEDRGIIAHALGKRPFVWLGDISYAVYIAHLLTFAVLGFVWDRSIRRMIVDPMVERSIFIVVGYTEVITVAGILHARFEKPERTGLRKVWDGSTRLPVN